MEKYPDTLIREIETVIPGKQLYHGLSDEFAKKLIRKSSQPHIIQSAPRDANERFRNPDALERWLSQGRDVYTLTGGSRLAGIVWYGQKEMPLTITKDRVPHHTFAIRIYHPYLGRGLAEPFMHDTLVDYMHVLADRNELEDFNGLWLSTKPDNFARKIYNEFGYKEIAFSAGEVIMILPRSGVAEILGA